MHVPAKLSVALAAGGAAAALMATPASAATTTVREDNATGAPYSGNWQVSTVGNLNFTISFLGLPVNATCDGASFTGTVTSTGAGTLTNAHIGACTTSNGLSSPPTTIDEFPTNTGAITYAPVAGGRDGTLTVDGALQFTLKGVFLGRERTCNYGFRTGSTDGISIDVFNRDNPNRPLPDDDAQGRISNITLVRLAGSDGLCPNNGKGTGNAIARGETAPGSGFDRKLYLTP